MENAREDADVPNQRFELRLLVRHPHIAPDQISQQFDLPSRMNRAAGAPRQTPAGTPLPGVNQDSVWSWSKRVEGRRAFFDEVVTLTAYLEPRKEFISQIVDTGGSVEIIVQLPGDVNIGSSIDPESLSRLAALKVRLGLEVFPNFGDGDVR